MDENFRKELNDLSKRVAFIESQLPFDTVKVECERTPEGEVQKLIFDETCVVGDGNLEIYPNGYKPRYSENDLRELLKMKDWMANVSMPPNGHLNDS